MMHSFAIIVAGGSGSRMQSTLPKQFLPLAGIPMIFHTLEAFLAFPDMILHLVLPTREIPFWDNVCQSLSSEKKEEIQKRVKIVAGGASRFQSVLHGLQAIPENIQEGIVLVHDGVRPLIEKSYIQAVSEAAQTHGAAALAVALKDTPREVLDHGGNRSLNRSRIQLMQTPQGFRLSLMREAFESGEQPHFTDCASVLEYAGQSVHLVEGSYRNIKVTTPEDLLIAEALWLTQTQKGAVVS